jgi:hypothetical protein
MNKRVQTSLLLVKRARASDGHSLRMRAELNNVLSLSTDPSSNRTPEFIAIALKEPVAIHRARVSKLPCALTTSWPRFSMT